MNNKEIFIKCECGSEGVFINHDTRDKTFEMCFMSNNPDNFKTSLLQRVRHMFKMLFTGKMHHDQIVMSDTQVKRMVDFFIQNNIQHETIQTYTINDDVDEKGHKQRQ